MSVSDIQGVHVTLLNNDIRHIHTLVANELNDIENLVKAGQADESQLGYRRFLVKKLEDLIAMSPDGEMLVVSPLVADE
ncbi:MAG: hypothetical protein BWK79_13935 [Beggiatoa sp. IS2]|nr:MAG: hypothetical protein BWK79_13935 [Beggiatoa sp. IS2]